MEHLGVHIEKTSRQVAVHRYDAINKIFEKDAHTLFMPFIKRKFGLKIKSYKPLPSELLWSRTESADFLCRITTEDGMESILHVEFQVNDNHETAQKVVYFQNSIFCMYNLPIQHIFFFLGEGDVPERMKHKNREKSKYNFKSLNISELNVEKLINSQAPEDLLLALMCDRKEERKELIMDKINRQLSTLMDAEDEFIQYSKQIMIASCL